MRHYIIHFIHIYVCKDYTYIVQVHDQTTKRTKISVTDLLKHVAIKVAKCVVVRACKALF